jgi:hypothetical protein
MRCMHRAGLFQDDSHNGGREGERRLNTQSRGWAGLGSQEGGTTMEVVVCLTFGRGQDPPPLPLVDVPEAWWAWTLVEGWMDHAAGGEVEEERGGEAEGRERGWERGV